MARLIYNLCLEMCITRMYLCVWTETHVCTVLRIITVTKWSNTLNVMTLFHVCFAFTMFQLHSGNLKLHVRLSGIDWMLFTHLPVFIILSIYCFWFWTTFDFHLVYLLCPLMYLLTSVHTAFRLTACAFRKLLSIYVFSYIPFCFEGRIWDLIVSLPNHCLSL